MKFRIKIEVLLIITLMLIVMVQIIIGIMELRGIIGVIIQAQTQMATELVMLRFLSTQSARRTPHPLSIQHLPAAVLAFSRRLKKRSSLCIPRMRISYRFRP